MNPTTLAAAVEAELMTNPPADLAYMRLYLTCLSPALAGAAARRIAQKIGAVEEHDVDHGWWTVGKHVTVIYDIPEAING